MHMFGSLRRLPAVWSSTSLCAPAGAAARRPYILPRFRGPSAHASAVNLTSAQTARRPSMARPPAELCSLDLTFLPPNRPQSYPAALAARGPSGVCDGALLIIFTDSFSWVAHHFWTCSIFHWLFPKLGQQGKMLEEFGLERLLYVRCSTKTLLHTELWFNWTASTGWSTC